MDPVADCLVGGGRVLGLATDWLLDLLPCALGEATALMYLRRSCKVLAWRCLGTLGESWPVKDKAVL